MCITSYCLQPISCCTIADQVKVIFEDDLGVSDFYTSSEAAVIYVSETDLVAGLGYRRKLAKLRKVHVYSMVNYIVGQVRNW